MAVLHPSAWFPAAPAQVGEAHAAYRSLQQRPQVMRGGLLQWAMALLACFIQSDCKNVKGRRHGEEERLTQTRNDDTLKPGTIRASSDVALHSDVALTR